MKALLNTFETVWCFQMLWINLIMIDLNEKFVLSGSVYQSWEWKKSCRNSSDMIPRMSWISYMDQYRSLWRQWLLQVEVTPSTRDRNLMTLAPAGEQMNFIVRWTKTFALGGTKPKWWGFKEGASEQVERGRFEEDSGECRSDRDGVIFRRWW